MLQINKVSYVTTTLIVLLVCVGFEQYRLVSAVERVRNFQEYLELANELDSAGPMAKQSLNEQRSHAAKLFQFTRESASELCRHRFDQLVEKAQEYISKAHEYFEEQRKRKNWMQNFMQVFGNPLSSMKAISRFDPMLDKMTQRYENIVKSNRRLSTKDMDCDITKFQIKSMNELMFVLQTDIRNVIMREPQLLNVAVYRNLQLTKLTVPHNFFEQTQLTPLQEKLLMDYFARHSKQDDELRVGDAISQVHELGRFRIGRMVEACSSLEEYQKYWLELEEKREHECGASVDDGSIRLFNLNNFKDTIEFCEGFTNSFNESS